MSAILVKNRYKYTDQQVEDLAREHQQGSDLMGQASTTILRVILVAAQAALGSPRGRAPSPEAQAEAVDAAHKTIYPAVLRGVGGEGPEAQRRATFARTSTAALMAYARARGDLRKLKADETTKSALRAAVAPPEPEDRTERTLTRAQGVILRAVRRMARGDPEEAAERLTELIGTLQAQLNELVPAEDRRDELPTVQSHTLRRTRHRPRPEARAS